MVKPSPFRRSIARLLASIRTDGVNNQLSYDIRIAVGIGASVFNVSLTVLSYLPRYTYRGASVRNTVRELIVSLGLVQTGQAVFYSVAITGYVLFRFTFSAK